MKINILGAEYDFEVTTETKEERLYLCNGYCDGYEKQIAIESIYDERGTKNVNELVKRVKRHEIIHAFLFESGLLTLAENEQIVDWISWQFPMMLKAFKSVNAIDE